MKDHTPVKIICRVINLLLYICAIFSIIVMAITEICYEVETIIVFFSKPFRIILICAIPIIIIMIITIIIKYIQKNKSKLNAYRILDTLARILSTIPITYSIFYYILNNTSFSELINTIIGLIIFIILNTLIKWTLQETLDVTFITSDSL